MIDLSLATENDLVKMRVGNGIRAKYLARDRYYHDISHIFDLQDKLEEYLATSSKTSFKLNEVKMALVLHDVIYDLPNHGVSNENKSANFFLKCVLKNLPSLQETVDVDLVTSLINSTEHFNPMLTVTEEDDFEYQLLHDLDFSPLGGTPERFDEDGRNIRKEHWYISETEFTLNRAKFLNTMLNRDHIYFLPYFQEKYEENAKKNLQESLQKLTE